MTDDGYLLHNAAGAAGTRLDLLAALFDPTTFRHLARLGVERGARCWEVGAGGPSVVRWMAERVGGTGRVVATDIDVSRLAGQAGGDNVEVLRHDVGVDPPPPGGFDVVHARLVLVHVPARHHALDVMVDALRPGGWLLVEDADPALQPLACLDPEGPEEQLANRIRTGFRELMAGRGVDLAYGRQLPRLLRAAGLLDVAADAWFPISSPLCADLERSTIDVIRTQLEAHGVVTTGEVDRHLTHVAAGRLDLTQPPLISAWGRKDGRIRPTRQASTGLR